MTYLTDNIDNIHTVGEWVQAMGYSRSHFSVLVKRELNETPYQIIKRQKYHKIRQLVRENPQYKGQVIACEAGFANVKDLYKFLRRHYNTTLTRLRGTVETWD